MYVVEKNLRCTHTCKKIKDTRVEPQGFAKCGSRNVIFFKFSPFQFTIPGNYLCRTFNR